MERLVLGMAVMLTNSAAVGSTSRGTTTQGFMMALLYGSLTGMPCRRSTA